MYFPYSGDNENTGNSLSQRQLNIGLVSSGVSLTSWGECTFLALVGHPSSDGIINHNENNLWGRCFFTLISLIPHLFIFVWLKLNLILSLDQLRLA